MAVALPDLRSDSRYVGLRIVPGFTLDLVRLRETFKPW